MPHAKNIYLLIYIYLFTFVYVLGFQWYRLYLVTNYMTINE